MGEDEKAEDMALRYLNLGQERSEGYIETLRHLRSTYQRQRRLNKAESSNTRIAEITFDL